jgi:DNA-binding NarL/FixJ family response regulator
VKEKMGCPRVLLVDNLREIRERVAQLLGSDFEIVAAQNGQQAMEAASIFNPDLLILDISMPILNGIQVASRLRESGARAKIIFLTVHQDADYIEAAFSVGASAYVFKSRLATDLIPAVQSVLGGQRFISIQNKSSVRDEDARFGHIKPFVAPRRA